MRKHGKTIMTIAAIIFLSSFAGQPAFSQSGKPAPKVKSLTVIEEKHENGAVTTNKESETKYDAKGNVIELIEYKAGKIETHFKYEYDENNNKIKETEYNKKGEVDKISEYKYKDGLRIEKTVYDADRKLLLKKTYQYTLY